MPTVWNVQVIQNDVAERWDACHKHLVSLDALRFLGGRRVLAPEIRGEAVCSFDFDTARHVNERGNTGHGNVNCHATMSDA